MELAFCFTPANNSENHKRQQCHEEQDFPQEGRGNLTFLDYGECAY